MAVTPAQSVEEPECGLDKDGLFESCTVRFYNLDRTESAPACLGTCILDIRPDLRKLF